MNYTIPLTQQQIQVIAAGLGELPMKIGMSLFHHIQAEVGKQDAASAVPVADIQKQFDAAVDRRDLPCGAPPP